MPYDKMRYFITILVIVTATITVLSLVHLKASAGPATSTNYYTLCIGSDCFRNWDSRSSSVFGPSTADWPVTIIYYGYAEVDKIKSAYDWWLTGLGNSMYMLMTDDGVTWFIDSDRGMKDVFTFSPSLNLCGYKIDVAYVHVRLYANPSTDYNYDPGLGQYVVATSHLDEWPLEKWSGFASVAEAVAVSWASQQLGWPVYPDYANGYNSDYCRKIGSHINYNDGWISFIYVPP